MLWYIAKSRSLCQKVWLPIYNRFYCVYSVDNWTYPLMCGDIPRAHVVLFEDDEWPFSVIVIWSIDKHLFRPRVIDCWSLSCNLLNGFLYPSITVYVTERNSFKSTLSSWDVERGHFVFVNCHLVLNGCYELNVMTVAWKPSVARTATACAVDYRRRRPSWTWHTVLSANLILTLPRKLLSPSSSGQTLMASCFSATFLPIYLTLHVVRRSY